jgi:hypothetical protein
MPIDPRIALSIVSPTYDFMGAYNTSRAAARTDLTNQMAQQAAEATATAQRNAFQEAQTLDPNNQAALRAYALRNPAAAEQVLGGLASADNLFSARNTDTRAQAEAATKQSEAYMAQLPQFASQLLGDASPPVIARVRAQWEGSGFPVGVFDALATRLADLPPEQQQQAIQSYLLTTGGGKTAVETRFGPRTLVNTGATQEARNLNPLALDAATGAPVPVTGPIQNAADPRAPTLMEDASGNVYRVPYAGGPATPVTTEGGGQLTARVPGAAPAADAGRAAAATTLRDALTQLETNFGILYRAGFMRGEGVSPAGNTAQFVRDKIPFLRGVQLSGNAQAATASDSIDTLLSTAVSTLSSLYGTSSRVMDAVKEMENVRKSFGSETMTYEAAVNAVNTVMRRVDELEAEQGGGAGSGGVGMPPVGARGATLTNSQTGATFVSDGTRWVPR